MEGYNAIGVGERYHSPLLRVFNAIHLDDPAVSAALALRFSLKTLNDTMGPDGLVPSLLAFGRLPLFPAHEGHPTQGQRKASVTVALVEASQAACEARVNKAIRSQVPPSARLLVHLGQKVTIFRENSRRWEGPFTVTRIVRKSVWVTDGLKVETFPISAVLSVYTGAVTPTTSTYSGAP